MNPVMYGYKLNQRAGQQIAAALGCAWHYPGSGYEYREGDLIVNWGNGHPLGITASILNKPRAIARSVRKDVTFDYMRNAGVCIPDNTTQMDIARQWIEQGEIVFCRKVLDGCNGAGIVVARTIEELSSAPMYTKYVYNDREFRVHVFKGEVIFFTEKGIARDASPNPNPMIKSGNDWSMQWVDDIHDFIKEDAIKATAAIGLDFAAIDMGYSESTFGNDDACWVFETNTAPGGFGPVTLQRYVAAIRKACE